MGVQHVTYPNLSNVNNYKEKGEKMIRMVKEKEQIAKLNFK